MRNRSCLIAAICILCASCGSAPQQAPDQASPYPEDLFFDVGGAKLHYLDWGGTGPLLLLVNGVTGTAHGFSLVAPAFTEDFRVMAVTRRGHGASDDPPTSFDVDLNVDDLARFIDVFSDGPAVVVGMSHGGIEVPRLARRYPDRVSALVLLDAVYEWRELALDLPLPGFELAPSYPSLAELDSSYSAQFAEFWSEELRRHLHSQVFTRSDGQVEWQLSLTGPTFARYVELWSEWDPADYEHVRVPVLAIRSRQEGYVMTSLTRRGFSEADQRAARTWAEYDDRIKDRGFELLLAALPEAEVLDLEATHHVVQFHRPGDVVRAMKAFFLEQLGF